MTPSETSDSFKDPKDFDRDALVNVVLGYDGPNGDEGWCPNWEIPARIPVQRLQGLKRRGYLRFSPKRGWQVTPLGESYLRELGT